MILCMSCVVYPNNLHWYRVATRNPSWEQIETAIRQLDRHKYPFVWFYRECPEDEESPYDVDVMGGAGAYWIGVWMQDDFYCILNPTNDDERIEIWTSDQGFETSAKHLLTSVDVVLRVVRHYHEHNALDPSVEWVKISTG